MRAAVYTRISDDREGRELGVKRQEEDCQELCRRNGWDEIAWYSDNDVSAVKPRQDWNRLLEDVRAGTIDAIAAYSSSRLYRDVDAEKARLFAACIERERETGQRVRIETFVSGTIDPYTADGRMVANIIASVDQAERERVAERVRRKRKEKDALGEFQGGPRPFGFQVVGKKLVPVESEARWVRQAASDVLSGIPLATIAKRWNDAGVRTTGGKPWRKHHVRQVLQAKRNVPQVLTATDFARVQELFDSRRKGRAVERYPLTGLVYCGKCGGRMGGRISYKDRGGEKTPVPLYACFATGKMHLSVGAQDLREEVVRLAADRPAPELVAVHDPSEELVQRREQLVREQEALGESDLSEAAIRGRDRRLQREIDALDRELQITRPKGHFAELMEDVEAFDERAWLETLIDRVTVQPASLGANRFDPRRVEISWR